MANPDPHPTPASNTSELSARLEGREPDLSVLGQDIDARMAAVLADHIEMGARPADDVTVAENRQTTTAEDAPAKPAAKKKRAAKKSK